MRRSENANAQAMVQSSRWHKFVSIVPYITLGPEMLLNHALVAIFVSCRSFPILHLIIWHLAGPVIAPLSHY
jgi:hypothetical protein